MSAWDELKNGWNEITGAIGSAWDAISGQKASRESSQKFNAEEALKQREFEKKLSSTAYQRAKKDMQEAGLNIAAMYGGGNAGAATTPSGSAASSGTGSAAHQISFGNLLHSAAALKDANTRRINEIETNKHLTEKEKNYQEYLIHKEDYLFAKQMEAMSGSRLKDAQASKIDNWNFGYKWGWKK